MLILSVKLQVSRNGSSSEYTFAAEDITIGSEPKSDIFLNHSDVESCHAVIRFAEDRVVLDNLHLPGATLHNGFPVHKQCLDVGSVINIGPYDITVLEIRDLRKATVNEGSEEVSSQWWFSINGDEREFYSSSEDAEAALDETVACWRGDDEPSWEYGICYKLRDSSTSGLPYMVGDPLVETRAEFDWAKAELAKTLGLEGQLVTWKSMIKTVKGRCVDDWLCNAFDEVVDERDAALVKIETLRDRILDHLYSEHTELVELDDNGILDEPGLDRLAKIEAEISTIRKAREDEAKAQCQRG